MFEEGKENIDKVWSDISQEIKKARDEHIPTILVSQTNTRKPQVLNESILHLIREKRWFYKRYKKYPSKTNYHLYCTSRDKVNYYLRKERRTKETKIANEMKGNTKQFYQYVTSKTSRRDPIPDLIDINGIKTTNDEEKSTLLNNYFCSVFTNENKETMPDFKQRIEESQFINSAEITTNDMKVLLEKLKPDKSPGTDEIHPRLLKESANSLAKPFKYFFDLSMKLAKIN